MNIPTLQQSGWYNGPWLWDSIRSNAGFITQFSSTNDPLVPWNEQQYVADNLRSELNMWAPFFAGIAHKPRERDGRQGAARGYAAGRGAPSRGTGGRGTFGVPLSGTPHLAWCAAYGVLTAFPPTALAACARATF
jgi:hypothetical protein